MLPPLSPDILTSNPNFESVYKAITTQLLDTDGSTRAVNISHRSNEEEFLKKLCERAKENILATSLQNAIFSKAPTTTATNINTLPDEIRELVYIVSDYLLTQPALTATQQAVLNDEIAKLDEHLSTITALLCQHLNLEYAHILSLVQLLPTASDSSTSKNQPPPITTTALETHLTSALSYHHTLTQTVLPTTTTTLLNTLTIYLTLQAKYLAQTLTHLSRHTHGTLSRHVISKSTHLSTIARALSAKTQILALEAQRSTYSQATQAALANYAAHLDAVSAQQLDPRVRVLEDETRLYAECDGREGRTMEELARKYAEVLSEIDVVKGDVEKLELRRGGGGKERKAVRKI